MLKKTVNYEDFNGNPKEKALYFNLTYPEIVNIMSKYPGISNKPEEYISKLVKNNDFDTMVQFIQDMILSAYGERSEDGEHFIKNAEIKKEFEESAVYGEFFTLIITDNKVMTDFVNNVTSKATKTRLSNAKKDNKSLKELPGSELAQNDDERATYEALKAKYGEGGTKK